jgi:hypothetical protein
MTVASLSQKLAFGTGGSVPIDRCQACGDSHLKSVAFFGYMPPVNEMRSVGSVAHEQPSYPLGLLFCPRCELVQNGLSIDPMVLFPPAYPYTSGTTRILRDNFVALAQECADVVPLAADDLVVDIGSNDGTLLSNFAGRHRVLGIEPTDVGKVARSRGIPVVDRYFSREVGAEVRREYGPAKVITAANCFAHIEDVHPVVEGILALLEDNGVFISESHYLIGLLDTLQYDTVYHEHLRYYSLRSLSALLKVHGVEVIHAVRIPTHGGSIRVYAARKGAYPVRPSVAQMIATEPTGKMMERRLENFRTDVVLSKLRLLSILRDVKEAGGRIAGISAPSRASTLINYVGLDDGAIDYVVEIRGSLKIGKYMPGTIIPIVEEAALFEDQPDYALVLSWHIADELIVKLKERGFRGRFIVPLPVPRVI